MSKINLPALQAKRMPRMDWKDLIAVKEGEQLGCRDELALFLYFRKFAPPQQNCLNCDLPLAGSLVEQLIGSGGFTWSLQHGEGYCKNCHYPARAIHYDVGPIRRFNTILQYHPDELKREERRERQAV